MEAASLLVVLLGLLIAIPLSVIIGTDTYRGQLSVADQQRATRHLATATLVEDAPTAGASTDNVYLSGGNATVNATASWPVPGGAQKVGTVSAAPGTSAGTMVPLWLSDRGDPVPAPLTSADAVATGTLAGISTWLAAAGSLIIIYWTVRLLLDRRRSARWDREWAHIGGRWARS